MQSPPTLLVIMGDGSGVDAAREWLVAARTEQGPLAVSTVAVAEITGGMRSPARREVNRLLRAVRVLPVTR